jgi:Protein of unknown function (DUF3800)
MAVIVSDPQSIPALSFFGDSSSRDAEYMVAGGFAVSGNRIAEIEDRIAQIKDDAGMRSEFHWSEYRGGHKRLAYENLVKYGFGLVNKRNAALHVIIVPFKGHNHKAVVGENKDTSINRMYYQLFVHRLGRFYGKSRAIHIRLDAGNDCSDICDMRNQLCAEAYKKFQTRPNCIRSIEPVDSANVGLIQLADVILGGIAAKQNAINHTSPKGALADFILTASGRHTWGESTPPNARFLTVWHHKKAVR